ncbi:NAD(P)/FAD-dependent oxidoreductase [Microbacterium aurum]
MIRWQPAGRRVRRENRELSGFPPGSLAPSLPNRKRALQVRKFGATLDIPATVKKIVEADDRFGVVFDDGREVTSEVVVATGVRYRSLPPQGWDRFQTSNVFYTATAQEARVCGDAQVAVVGGGNSAGQAALFLARTSSRVYLVWGRGCHGTSWTRFRITRVDTVIGSRRRRQRRALEPITRLHTVNCGILRSSTCSCSSAPSPPPTGWLSGLTGTPSGTVPPGPDAEISSGSPLRLAPLDSRWRTRRPRYLRCRGRAARVGEADDLSGR